VERSGARGREEGEEKKGKRRRGREEGEEEEKSFRGRDPFGKGSPPPNPLLPKRLEN
jgi:hypothetical protein